MPREISKQDGLEVATAQGVAVTIAVKTARGEYYFCGAGLDDAPTRNQLDRGAHMTIAAGYHCIEGIVLCADTEEAVQEYIRRDVHKIVRYPDSWGYKPDNHSCLFAGAGDGTLIDALALKMWNGVKNLPSPSLDDIVDGLEEVLIREYQKLVLAFHKDEMPQAQFLVAIHSAAERNLELVEVNGPVVRRQLPYSAVGYGLTLHTYLASRMLYPKIGLEATSNVMTYIIDQVKTHVMHCGGETHLYTLDYEGHCQLLSESDIRNKTEALREIDRIARHIAGVAMNTSEPEQARGLIDSFTKELFEAITTLVPKKKTDQQ